MKLSKLGLPNIITLGRIVLIPVFMLFLLVRIPYGGYLAAAVFTLAALTDSLDGYIARRNRQVSKLGIFLDPLADKLLMTAALVSLVELHQVPAWIAFIILAREFAVTGLRAVKAEEGVVIPASKWGKAKTVTQIIAILVVIFSNIYQSWVRWPVGEWVMYFAMVITVISGLDYFARFLKPD
ncbi:MAG: CDP-diacylglycerol--glycerol-3-phosphate 3-phosphatidyltransferase [Chitinophagales bacterium]